MVLHDEECNHLSEWSGMEIQHLSWLRQHAYQRVRQHTIGVGASSCLASMPGCISHLEINFYNVLTKLQVKQLSLEVNLTMHTVMP